MKLKFGIHTKKRKYRLHFLTKNKVLLNSKFPFFRENSEQENNQS